MSEIYGTVRDALEAEGLLRKLSEIVKDSQQGHAAYSEGPRAADA